MIDFDGQDIEVSVDVTMTESILGGEKEVTFDRDVKCATCDGQRGKIKN